MTVDRIFWSVCIPCGAVANILAFWIFARTERLGFDRPIWSVWGDLGLYRIYWQKAPENGWSRTPLVAMGLLLGVALSALLVAFLFVSNV